MGNILDGLISAADFVSKRKYLLALLPLFFVVLFFIFFDYQHTGSLKTAEFTYQGSIQAGKPQGTGTMTFTNGDTYVGGFSAGKFNSTGTYTSKAGKWTYEGDFSDGLATGKGTMTTPDGQKHEMSLKDGVMQK